MTFAAVLFFRITEKSLFLRRHHQPVFGFIFPDVDALHHAFRDALQQPGDVGATAAADIQDLVVFFDLHRRQGPVGHLGVTAAVHPVHHHFAEEAFGLARIAENLTE